MRHPKEFRTLFGRLLVALLAVTLLGSACDDPPLDESTADDAAEDTATVDAATADAGVVDGGGADVAPADSAGADSESGDAGTGSDGDSPVDDSATADAGAQDTAAANPCSDCVWDEQPTGDHPSAKSKTSLLEPKKVEFGTGLFQGYKEMLVFQPLTPGIHPVLFFVPGKQLHTTGGLISAKLGHAYMALLEHVARRGYIVAFVRVENLGTDCDHNQMANTLLEATKKLFATVSTADKERVAFAGHSMGAKVAVLAAAKTLVDDKKNQWADPEALFLFNLSNEKPAICLAPWADASAAVKYIDPKAKVHFTLVQSDDDKVAPYKDKSKPNSVAVYDGLKVTHRQIIVLHGTGKDDANPATDPELHDDHAAPLTVKGKVGGIADWGLPDSYLDGLDYYGYWKILVGGLDFHFLKGDATWAYGDMRTHGGTLPGGKTVVHEVYKQGW